MATIITTNFGAIQDALNTLIINEVKDALRLVPGKKIGERFRVKDKTALCHIVISHDSFYSPRDLAVWSVWLDDEDKLHISGGTGHDPLFPEDYDEDDDMLNITDFHYLIEQIKPLIPESAYELKPDDTITLSDYIHMNRLREVAETARYKY